MNMSLDKKDCLCCSPLHALSGSTLSSEHMSGDQIRIKGAGRRHRPEISKKKEKSHDNFQTSDLAQTSVHAEHYLMTHTHSHIHILQQVLLPDLRMKAKLKATRLVMSTAL